MNGTNEGIKPCKKCGRNFVSIGDSFCDSCQDSIDEHEGREEMHRKLYDAISMIPNGTDFLVAVNEGLTELKSLREQLASERALRKELVGVIDDALESINEYGEVPFGKIRRMEFISERAKECMN